MKPARPPPDAILPLQQHPFFADALARMGRDVTSLALQDGARRIGHVQLISRRFGPLGRVALASCGPVWCADTPPHLRRDMLRALGKRGLRIVNANEGIPKGAGFHQIISAAHLAEVDLRGDLCAAMHPKWRNRLVKARSAPLTLQHDIFDSDRHGWLLLAERAQQKARGYRALPAAITLAYAAAHPAQVRVITARDGQTPVAAMLFLCHGPVATYHMGWSGPQGRATGAHNLILHAAMAWLADQGHVRLDLGTVDTQTNPGLARFKIGAGATLRATGGTWLRLPDFGLRWPRHAAHARA
ncbi:GNAT family N-acetyltransferase [Octadecabacter sp. R77987]|uniref:GNAT family N-acetyltransferase n=1 Tax=Octadecabacter sp. R77987 TaxID=3093874 RepID=UPI00366B7947